MAHDHDHDHDHAHGAGHEGHSHGVSADADRGELAIARGLTNIELPEQHERSTR
jgi:cobalt-zinc-cadmium efflux system protein